MPEGGADLANLLVGDVAQIAIDFDNRLVADLPLHQAALLLTPLVQHEDPMWGVGDVPPDANSEPGFRTIKHGVLPSVRPRGAPMGTQQLPDTLRDTMARAQHVKEGPGRHLLLNTQPVRAVWSLGADVAFQACSFRADVSDTEQKGSSQGDEGRVLVVPPGKTRILFFGALTTPGLYVVRALRAKVRGQEVEVAVATGGEPEAKLAAGVRHVAEKSGVRRPGSPFGKRVGTLSL